MNENLHFTEPFYSSNDVTENILKVLSCKLYNNEHWNFLSHKGFSF